MNHPPEISQEAAWRMLAALRALVGICDIFEEAGALDGAEVDAWYRAKRAIAAAERTCDTPTVTGEDLADAIQAILDTERDVRIAAATRDDPAEYVTAVEDLTLRAAEKLAAMYRAAALT